MPLSWNEIKHRAIAFSKEWKDETREEAEAKSFWDAFFHVFGHGMEYVRALVDSGVERDDLQTGAETDSLSQRERVRVRENAT